MRARVLFTHPVTVGSAPAGRGALAAARGETVRISDKCRTSSACHWSDPMSVERAPFRIVCLSDRPRPGDLRPTSALRASHRTVSEILDGRSAPLPIQITSSGTKSRASPLLATDYSHHAQYPPCARTRRHLSRRCLTHRQRLAWPYDSGPTHALHEGTPSPLPV